MKACRTVPSLLVSLLCACGSGSSQMRAELDALRAEVAELRARDQERSESVELIENRVFILEGGVQEVAERPSRELPVVAIGPEAEASEPETEVEEPVEGDLPEIHAPDAAATRRSERRPALKIQGRQRPAGGTGEGGGRFPPLPPRGGEPGPLGVVEVPGLEAPPGSAPPPAAPPAPLERASTLARAGRCAEAVGEIANESGAAEMYLLAECFARLRRHLDAIGAFERLQRRHRGHRPADVLLGLGTSYAALGDHQRARQLFFQVVENHPGTPAARSATQRVARLGGNRGGQPR